MIEVRAGRRRIKEKGIKWDEHYGDKSKDVKEKFDEILPGLARTMKMHVGDM